ncbi:MAG: response regulator [Gemmataceae bacterium]|nr:response regulator [Gemmataceae bacterium]
MKVLVVDDNPDLARSSALLLELEGHDARVAETGREAVAAAAEFRPEAVLLDLRLPDLPGAEVARHVRAELGRAVVILGVSGLDPEDRPPAEAELFDRHLVKPLDLTDFGRLVGEVRRAAATP